LIAFLLVSCKGGDVGDVKVVSKIPDGFISLSELDNHADSILRCLFWENNIVFVLKEDSSFNLYQNSLGNSDIVVKYNEEYYVNEAIFLELNEVAVLALEQL
jgi:hypothetical protein